MNDREQVDSLILLVGSNPLPNYLAAMALKPSTIHLVHTEETKEPKDRLRDALSADLGSSVTIDGDAFVNDPFSASAVDEKVRDLIVKCNATHLHYTGGTKVMSAHALRAFYEKGGQAKNASYLDEAQTCLRFDGNLPSRSLSDCGVTLTLDRILQLHGVTQKTRSSVNGGPTVHDIAVISCKELADPQLAKKLYDKSNELKKHKDQPANAISVAFDSAEYGLAFSVGKVPGEAGWGKDQFKAWWRFLGGEWLEDWVAGQIRTIDLPEVTNKDISVGVTCTRTETGREFEVDVAVLRGQRSYFLACTTDTSLGLCKFKAFEITARSRQMGGDLARSALVCLLHGQDGKGKFIDQIRADIADVWGSSNATRIFGLDDLRDWAGHNGSPSLGELKSWLDS